MGREFELKYRCTPESFRALQENYDGFATLEMETAYYDTFDGRLGNYRWTLRRRMENGNPVCTLKIPLSDGSRGEWEVECGSIMAAVPKLCQLGAPMDLMAFCVSGVAQVCGARFTRQALTLEVPGAIVELALDAGVLLGGGRELPLMEVEVELKSGSDAAAADYAARLAREYGLVPEADSKYRRALRLSRGG